MYSNPPESFPFLGFSWSTILIILVVWCDVDDKTNYVFQGHIFSEIRQSWISSHSGIKIRLMLNGERYKSFKLSLKFDEFDCMDMSCSSGLMVEIKWFMYLLFNVLRMCCKLIECCCRSIGYMFCNLKGRSNSCLCRIKVFICLTFNKKYSYACFIILN